MAAELEIPNEKLAVVGALGIVSPLGNDEHTFWKRLVNGDDGIKYKEFPEYRLSKVKVAGLVEGFEEDDWERLLVGQNIIDPSDFDFYSVSTFAALEVTRQALAPFTVFQEVDGRFAPRLDPEIFNSDRIGLVMAGEGGGTVEETITTYERIKAKKRAETESIIRGLVDTPLGAITRAYGIHGGASGVYAACASGEDAIAYARSILLNPQSKLEGVIVMGTEFSNNLITRSQFEAITALSTSENPNQTPRPFDKRADGFVISNAAAAIFLVRPDFARRHNLKVRAWHLGSGAYEEGYSMTHPLPNGEGTYRAYRELWNMTVGGRRIGDMRRNALYFTKAHGTGTKGDPLEAMGIRRTTEEHKSSLAGFGSFKGALGHPLSAAAVVEFIPSIKILEEGVMPPNIKCDNPIDEVDGMPLIREATAADIEFVDTLSNGFGGHQRAGTFQSVRSTI